MKYRFRGVQFDDVSKQKQQAILLKYEELETLIETTLDDGRARQLCLTNLETSHLWVGKSLRDSQIHRTKEEPK